MAQTDQSAVDADVYAKSTTPALDPVEWSVEEEAQGFARRLKTLQGGERLFNVSKVQGELRTLLKNQERGYSGWEFRIAVLRRTLELVEVS